MLLTCVVVFLWIFQRRKKGRRKSQHDSQQRSDALTPRHELSGEPSKRIEADVRTYWEVDGKPRDEPEDKVIWEASALDKTPSVQPDAEKRDKVGAVNDLEKQELPAVEVKPTKIVPLSRFYRPSGLTAQR